MTTRAAFTDEEWKLVVQTPTLVGMAVARAEESGLGSLKELFALVRGMQSSRKTYQDNEFILALTSAAVERKDGEDPLSIAVEPVAYRDRVLQQGSTLSQELGDKAVAACASVLDLLQTRVTPSELADYKTLVLDLAQRVAESAKEGGVLGIGGERVSPGEVELIARVRAALKA